MKCERCESVMREQEVVVRGGTIKTKGLAVWHCLDCGRIDYRKTGSHDLILEDAEAA
jgi:RNase P subunit RPR2